MDAPLSRVFMGAMTSGRRARLPTWVVIMRSVLRFTASFLPWVGAVRIAVYLTLPGLGRQSTPRQPVWRGVDCTSGWRVQAPFPLPRERVRERPGDGQNKTGGLATAGWLVVLTKLLLEVVAQLLRARGVTQLAQGLRFDLADALAGYVELAAYFLEGAAAAVFEAEA